MGESHTCIELRCRSLQTPLNPLPCQVDSVYSPSFGRRKSWLVPAQLLCGVMMLWARGVMDVWIGENGEIPQITTLTVYFLALYFIMATQVCCGCFSHERSCRCGLAER